MGNTPNSADFTKTITQFLADSVDNGTYNDIIGSVLKFDATDEDANATDIDAAAGQLWSNLLDDYIRATWNFFHESIKMWTAADGTARDAFGSDNALAVDDVCWVKDVKQFWYVVSVDGAAASTWAAVTGGGLLSLSAEYRFSTTITMADPGNGRLRFNNATQPSATAMAISKTTDNGKAVGGILVNLINAGWQFYIQNQTDDTKWHRVNITSAPTDNGTWVQYVIAVSASGAALGNNDKCILIFVEDAAATAVPVSHGPRWEKDGGIADADPGAGKYRYNHATQASATFLFVNDACFDGQDMKRSWLEELTDTDEIFIQQEGTPANVQRWAITQPVTDGGGYQKIPIVAPVGGIAGDIADGAKAGFTFWTGNRGLFGALSKGNATGPLDIIVSAGQRIVGAPTLVLEGATATVAGDVLITAGDATGGDNNSGRVVLTSGTPDGSGARKPTTVSNVGPDTDAVITLSTSGTNAASSNTFVGDRDPNGNVTGDPGDRYVRVGGTSSALYLHTGSSSSNSDWTDISGGGGGVPEISSVEVSRTTDLTITGTPTGLAFNSETGGSFDAAVYTWVTTNSDIEVDVNATYEIHAELSVVTTSTSESEYIMEWYVNDSPEGAFQRLSTAGSGFDDTPTPVSSTIQRVLSNTDTIGVRISRTSGSGGFVDAGTARLSLKRLKNTSP